MALLKKKSNKVAVTTFATVACEMITVYVHMSRDSRKINVDVKTLIYATSHQR